MAAHFCLRPTLPRNPSDSCVIMSTQCKSLCKLLIYLPLIENNDLKTIWSRVAQCTYLNQWGQLFESMRSVPSQKDLIGLMDLHEHCLCIPAWVVVWMPCLSQLPIAASNLLKRGTYVQWQYLQCLFFSLGVLFEQYFQHPPPSLFIIPPSSKNTKDSIRH